MTSTSRCPAGCRQRGSGGDPAEGGLGGPEAHGAAPAGFAALLAAARTSGPNDHALVCLLGMLGLRVSEACATDITDLRYEAGCEVLHGLGKGQARRHSAAYPGAAGGPGSRIDRHAAHAVAAYLAGMSTG